MTDIFVCLNFPTIAGLSNVSLVQQSHMYKTRKSVHADVFLASSDLCKGGT